MSQLFDVYRTPSMIKLIEGITPKLTGIDLLKTSGMASQLERMIATLAPQRAALDALATAQLAQYNPLRDQMLQLVSAQESVGRLFAGINYSTALAGLLETVGRYGQVQSHLASVTIRPEFLHVLRGHTTRSGRYYNSYLDGLPTRPIARRATVARQAGDAQTGLLIAESLTAPDLDEDNREELAERLATTVLEPWQTGPADARTDLFDALAGMDPGLPDWLKAAWDDIARDGPKAASKIANCTVECIDHALRLAAPPADVARWISTIPPKQGYPSDDSRRFGGRRRPGRWRRRRTRWPGGRGWLGRRSRG